MTTLIAGGTGFIGLNIAEACLAAGEDVLLADLAPPPAAAAEAFGELPGTWRHIELDVTDEHAVVTLFRGAAVDAVYYAAAITSGAAREREHPERVVAVNLLGLTHVLKAAAAHGVRRVINVGSGAAYGDGGLARCGATAPLDEDASRSRPSTLYGVTKLAAEGVTRRVAALGGLDAVSVRLAIIFGPWERDTGWRDTLSAPMQIARRALDGAPARLARRDARDWTYSRDVAAALRALMHAGSLRHDLYHVSSGRACAALDWGEALAAHFPGFECRLVEAGETPDVDLHGDDDRLAMSPRRLVDDLGHTVPGDVDATTADFAAWLKRWPGYWSR